MQKFVNVTAVLCGNHNRIIFALIGCTALIAALLVWEVRYVNGNTLKLRTGTFEQFSADRKSQGLDLELIKVVHRASKISMHGFWIVQGKRSQVEQDRLYEQGRSHRGAIVTWTRHSKHVEGRAIDFQPLDVEGRPTWDRRAFESTASEFKRAAAEVGVHIDWGYDLWNKDLGHIELSTREGQAR